MFKYAIGFTVGCVVGLLVLNAKAHTPCNDVVESPPICKYVQVYDPYLGKMRSEYVCR